MLAGASEGCLRSCVVRPLTRSRGAVAAGEPARSLETLSCTPLPCSSPLVQWRRPVPTLSCPIPLGSPRWVRRRLFHRARHLEQPPNRMPQRRQPESRFPRASWPFSSVTSPFKSRHGSKTITRLLCSRPAILHTYGLPGSGGSTTSVASSEGGSLGWTWSLEHPCSEAQKADRLESGPGGDGRSQARAA